MSVESQLLLGSPVVPWIDDLLSIPGAFSFSRGRNGIIRERSLASFTKHNANEKFILVAQMSSSFLPPSGMLRCLDGWAELVLSTARQHVEFGLFPIWGNYE